MVATFSATRYTRNIWWAITKLLCDHAYIMQSKSNIKADKSEVKKTI